METLYSISFCVSVAETTGSQYSYVGARRAREAQAAFLEQADTPTRSGTGHGPTQEPAKDLELAFESDAEQQQARLDAGYSHVNACQHLFVGTKTALANSLVIACW